MRIQGIAGEPRKIGTRPLLRESSLPFREGFGVGLSAQCVLLPARDRQRREELQHRRQTTQ